MIDLSPASQLTPEERLATLEASRRIQAETIALQNRSIRNINIAWMMILLAVFAQQGTSCNLSKRLDRLERATSVMDPMAPVRWYGLIHESMIPGHEPPKLPASVFSDHPELACSKRALWYVHVPLFGLNPACGEHAGDAFVASIGGRRLDRLRTRRLCEFDRLPAAPTESTSLRMVIAEAIQRCACGSIAEVCLSCARLTLRPLARTIVEVPRLARRA